MSRSPAHLAAAAVALRALAAALSADFDGLIAHTGPSTWEGPAADAHRRQAIRSVDDGRAVAAEVARLADRLDDRAAEIIAADRAEAVRHRQRAALAGGDTDPAVEDVPGTSAPRRANVFAGAGAGAGAGGRSDG